MSTLQDRRQRILKELKEVEVEENRLRTLTPAQRVAEFLHENMCHASHEDQCGWYYESWEEMREPYSSRKNYLEKAQRMLVAANGDEAYLMRILEELFS